MGAQKQLLKYRGKTLLEHCVGQALEADLNPIAVVVGAGAAEVKAAVAAYPVTIVENPAWESGMGSSLSCGLGALRKAGADIDAVAVLLADQPLVRAGHLSAMWHLLQTGANPAVAAQYSGGLGVPAIFKRELFEVLARLAPAAGARRLLRESGLAVTPYELPEAAVDIDTPEDFARLQQDSPSPSQLA